MVAKLCSHLDHLDEIDDHQSIFSSVVFSLIPHLIIFVLKLSNQLKGIKSLNGVLKIILTLSIFKIRFVIV